MLLLMSSYAVPEAIVTYTELQILFQLVDLGIQRRWQRVFSISKTVC